MINITAPPERVLLVEHPYREDWRLVTPEKPAERSRDVYRFQVTVPAGQAHKLDVVEELRRTETDPLVAQDLRALFRMHTGSKSAFPYLFETLEDELGFGVACTADAIELTERSERSEPSEPAAQGSGSGK